MRIGGSVLISSIALALIGGFAVGVSIDSLVAEKNTTRSDGLHFPTSEAFGESDPIQKSIPPEALREAMEDPVVNIQSILDSTKFTSDFDQRVALYALLERAEEDDLNGYIEDSSVLDSINQRVAALSIIFGRYAAINPKESLARALALKQLTMQEKSIVLHAIFNEWTVRDVSGAVSALTNLPQQFRFSAAAAVLARSDFLDTQQRIQLVQQIGLNETWVENAVASIRSDAARGDPQNAFYNLIREQRLSQDHYAELFGIVRHWFELDGIAILPEIHESLPNKDARKYVLEGLVRHAIGTKLAEPETVLSAVAEIPNNREAKQAIEYALRSWSNYEPKQAFQASIGFSDQLVTPHFRTTLMQIWANNDPEGLFAEASGLPEIYRDTAVIKALGQMSTDTPDGAIRYARGLETRPLRILARDEILTQWSSFDAKSAFEWLMSDGFDGSHRRSPSIWREIFAKYLEQDLEAAKTFAENYKGTIRNHLIANVARKLIYVDIDRAIAYVPNVEDWRQGLLREEIGRRIVLRDQNRAMTYGMSIEERAQRRYFESVINEWAYRDLVDLTENIQLVPPKFRPIAAKEILGWNEEKGYLSDHQITRLEAMAPSEEEELIVTSGGC